MLRSLGVLAACNLVSLVCLPDQVAGTSRAVGTSELSSITAKADCKQTTWPNICTGYPGDCTSGSDSSSGDTNCYPPEDENSDAECIMAGMLRFGWFTQPHEEYGDYIGVSPVCSDSDKGRRDCKSIEFACWTEVKCKTYCKWISFQGGGGYWTCQNSSVTSPGGKLPTQVQDDNSPQCPSSN